MTIKKERVWEIDLLRGIALILMIYIYILSMIWMSFFCYNVSYEWSFNGILASSGLCSSLSRGSAVF
jgi:uncharacterized membrane protein